MIFSSVNTKNKKKEKKEMERPTKKIKPTSRGTLPGACCILDMKKISVSVVMFQECKADQEC